VLVDQTAATYPDYHVPSGADLENKHWTAHPDGTMLPYAVWGDFDGNSALDVAIVLMKGETGRIEFFLQQPSGQYAAFHFGPGNETWGNAGYMRLLTKGEAQEFYTCSGDGTDPHHLAFDHDVVVFTDWQDFRSIYRWNGVDISRDDEVECD